MKILIIGGAGQDGILMTKYLSENTDHEVYSIARNSGKDFFFALNLLHGKTKFINGDINNINEHFQEIKPDYLINFAANTDVENSWRNAIPMFETNALAIIKCLEAIKTYNPKCRFFNAGSSEEMAGVQYVPQDEKHPIAPLSPYGASKASARHILNVYRESYGLYAVHGILFAHDSPFKNERFVTRKISRGISQIKLALGRNLDIEPITLGNLDSRRDWSAATDFMDGIWRMLNQDLFNPNFSKVKDYVLANGESHSVREVIELAFKYAGIDYLDTNSDRIAPVDNEKADQINYTTLDHKPLIVVNRRHYRPAEAQTTLGDATLAKKELNWRPQVNFENLIKEIVLSDLD